MDWFIYQTYCQTACFTFLTTIILVAATSEHRSDHGIPFAVSENQKAVVSHDDVYRSTFRRCAQTQNASQIVGTFIFLKAGVVVGQEDVLSVVFQCEVQQRSNSLESNFRAVQTV